VLVWLVGRGVNSKEKGRGKKAWGRGFSWLKLFFIFHFSFLLLIPFFHQFYLTLAFFFLSSFTLSFLFFQRGTSIWDLVKVRVYDKGHGGEAFFFFLFFLFRAPSPFTPYQRASTGGSLAAWHWGRWGGRGEQTNLVREKRIRKCFLFVFVFFLSFFSSWWDPDYPAGVQDAGRLRI
jgi:hypothetical protein